MLGVNRKLKYLISQQRTFCHVKDLLSCSILLLVPLGPMRNFYLYVTGGHTEHFSKT